MIRGFMDQKIPNLDDIHEAAERIRPYAHLTPVMTCRQVDERCGGAVYFKCENLQKVGAFKFRGACNAVFSLSDEQARNGVATHSSGNHAQALALSAKLRGIPAYIAMPSSAPEVKKKAVAGYGASIRFCDPTQEAREHLLEEIVKETGAVFISPYNDPAVIAGQGTAALELLEQVPDLDIVTAPVGGGGLISGTAIAVHGISREIKTIGAEPAQADDAMRSFKSGKLLKGGYPDTIADGLRTSLGELTFTAIQKELDDIVTVPEASIIEAMRFIWERMKIIIEPSSAVPVAALFEGKIEAENKRIGVILSGGNVDLARLPWQ